MIGTELDVARDYPADEPVEVVWAPTFTRDAPPALLEWLSAEGANPAQIVKDDFAVERMPDGVVRIVFREYVDATVHQCPVTGCADQHRHKTPMQYRVMSSPIPDL